MTAPAMSIGCPDERQLVAFLEERLAEPQRQFVAAHVGNCTACTAALERLSSRWSFAPIAGDTDRPLGADTLAIAARLADRPPDPAISGAGPRDAAIPRATPTIPGLVDLEPIGRGGMGVVYRARETALDRMVAVKLLWSFGPLSETARARAAREALMLARLNHPNVITIHGTGETVEGVPYLVMEWVPGRSLHERIDAGSVSPREVARIARDLARGLSEVHALGIVHRDLKPDNILLSPAAGPAGELPKLADFGLARPDDAAANLTQPDAIAGTPAFMAAEQTGLDPTLGDVGPATDIHGLGAVLYAAIVGRPPYDAKTPGESLRLAVQGKPAALATLAARCPPDLRTIVEKCLRPDPVHRYRSAGDLADDLDRYLNGLPVVARPLSRVQRIAKWTRRQPLAAAALALAMLATLSGLAGTAFQLARLRRANAEITRSRDAADDANAVARRSLARLTDAAVRRLMVRGEPLNDEDRRFLQMVRDDYVNWPLQPDPRTNLRFRADGLTQLAQLLFEIDQYSEALAAQEPLLTALEQLETLDHDPATGPLPPSLERLGAMRMERLIISRMSGPEAAEAATRRALALIEAAPSDDLPYRREHAAVLFEHGWHLAALGRDEESVAALDRGLELLAEIRAEAPDDPEAMRLEVAGLFNTGLAHANAGRADAQAALIERLVSSTSATLARSSDVPMDVPKGLGLGLAFLAGWEAKQGHWSEAIALGQRRLDICRGWLARFPSDSVMRGQAIDAGLELARACGETGQVEEQNAVLKEAVALAEAGVAAEPAVFDSCFTLARVLLASAGAVSQADPTAATARLEQAIDLMMPWSDLEGRQQEVKDMVVNLHVALAQVFAVGGNHAEELRHLEQAALLVPADYRERMAAMVDAARSRAGGLAAGETPATRIEGEPEPGESGR